jgi:hypothetical protein
VDNFVDSKPCSARRAAEIKALTEMHGKMAKQKVVINQ